MTKLSKKTIAKLVLGVVSMGMWGYLIWKFGLLDVIVFLLTQLLLMIPMFMVIIGLVEAQTYDRLQEELQQHYDKMVKYFENNNEVK